MSILIKGMKMPTDCTKCTFCNDRTLFCWATREFISGFGHPKFCPLEEVPETHDKRTETHACDLIDRQAAIDALNVKIHLSVFGNINAIAVKNYIRLVSQRLHELPSAQPELIRCKDCKYWQDPICARPENKFDKHPFIMMIGKDGFCSFAERRTDESIHSK